MNRRRFIQSLAAVFTLPATPKLALGSAGAVSGAAAAVPTQARFWAIYMSALHGECTPQTLQNLLHIPEVDSKRYIGQLIADGVIKPNPLLQNTVTELVKPKDDGLVEKVKKRFEREKAKAEPIELDVQAEADPERALDEEPEIEEETVDEVAEAAAQEQPLDAKESVTNSSKEDSEH